MLSSPCVVRITSYRRMPISIVVRFAFALSSYIMFFSMHHGNLLVYVQVVCWQCATLHMAIRRIQASRKGTKLNE